MSGKLGSAIVIFSYAIVLFLMVRPNSQGPNLVNATGSALSNVIHAGTGGAGWYGQAPSAA
jgi:hypothetical protein